MLILILIKLEIGIKLAKGKGLTALANTKVTP
jgi:hypothetical protein